MSGSPIIQDGRLVGAITHVFINDPKRIRHFIELMLSGTKFTNNLISLLNGKIFKTLEIFSI